MRLTLLACLLMAGCVKPHPVQPSPVNWQLPKDYAHCEKQEQVTWPDGRVTIVASCPSGSVFLDKVTGKPVDLDSLDFRK